MAATLLAALVAGALIGPLVHAALPHHHDLAVRTTAVLGALGAAVGTWIYMAASGAHAHGVDGASLLVGAVVAGVIIARHRLVSQDARGDWRPTERSVHGRSRPNGYER